MKYIDISWPISQDMTTYKNRKEITIEDVYTFSDKGLRQSKYEFGSHVGTHIDAPSHFLEHGKTIEFIQLDKLIGSCQVIDFTHVKDKITRQDFEGVSISSYSGVLLKTKNSFLDSAAPFDPNFISIDVSAAEYLVSCKINAIGFDYLGIERGNVEHETHKAFLEAGIPIVEGLRLAHVEAGQYQLVCLPLLIPGRDAAQARAVLFYN